MQRKPMVAANWKMNGDLALIKQMTDTLHAQHLGFVDVVVCPPAPFLYAASNCDWQLGGQNISHFENGAHTGEVSADMLKRLGCQYVIVGHSERRADNHESNSLVAAKVAKALEHDLTPILCVGEPLDIRDSGQLFSYLDAQLDAVVELIGIEAMCKLVLAYEPVWAIGTGKTASPQQAQEVHQYLRERLANMNSDIAANMRILYGGSVKGDNAEILFSQPDVDGGLIGGASLKPDEFLTICQAAKVKA